MEITRSIMPTLHVPNITLASIMRTFQGKMKEGWVVWVISSLLVRFTVRRQAQPDP